MHCWKSAISFPVCGRDFSLLLPIPTMAAPDVWEDSGGMGRGGPAPHGVPHRRAALDWGSALAPQRDLLQPLSCSAVAWAGLPSFAAFSWGDQTKVLGERLLFGFPPWCAGVPPWAGGDSCRGSMACRLGACLGLSVVKCHRYTGLCMSASPLASSHCSSPVSRFVHLLDSVLHYLIPLSEDSIGTFNAIRVSVCWALMG